MTLAQTLIASLATSIVTFIIGFLVSTVWYQGWKEKKVKRYLFSDK